MIDLTLALEDLLSSPPRCGKAHVIAIDGPAGAGKTTLANELFLSLSLHHNVELIHLDEMYAGWDLALTKTLTETLSQVLETLSVGNMATYPIYDWTWGQFDSDRQIFPCDVLIIEGVGSAQKLVREFATATIWLDIDPEIGLRRVLDRDGNQIEEQMNRWQIRESEHFRADSTRENADFILSTV